MPAGTERSDRVRLLAIDIDGTLLDSRWELPEANREAVARAAEAGIEVLLVTGRRFDFALPIAEMLGELAGELTLIVNNGALVKSRDGATHLRHLLPLAVARDVLRALPQFAPGAALVFDRPRAAQVVFQQIDWEDPERAGYFERNRAFLAEANPLESALTEDPIQLMYTGAAGAMREVAARLELHPRRGEFAMAVTEYLYRNFSLVDVVGAGISKGATLAEWAARRGVRREEVMAIGDNLNDREMLEYAGVPVVMGNAVEGLKRNGWPLTLSNDDAGVAHAIRTWALDRG
jgi:Cof subfamily protein (haloacid dehalogenase superfamily)